MMLIQEYVAVTFQVKDNPLFYLRDFVMIYITLLFLLWV